MHEAQPCCDGSSRGRQSLNFGADAKRDGIVIGERSPVVNLSAVLATICANKIWGTFSSSMYRHINALEASEDQRHTPPQHMQERLSIFSPLLWLVLFHRPRRRHHLRLRTKMSGRWVATTWAASHDASWVGQACSRANDQMLCGNFPTLYAVCRLVSAVR